MAIETTSMPDRPRLHLAALAASLAGALALAVAGTSVRADELTGTLKTASEKGAVTIGYRESSLPFSYLSGAKEPIGYAIDICQAVIDDMAKEVGRERLDIRYKPVTSESRFGALTSGEIDLECGSTTANLERRKIVDFSPVTFVSATKLLVRKDSPIKSYRDLGGRKVVVTAGTTNEAAVKAIAARLKMDVTVVTARDHADSFRLVRAGEADAFALDDVLLSGLTVGAEGQDYAILPAAISYEPYAIMFRKDDPAFAAIVAGTFNRLAESREITWIYERWFTKRLPGGERLSIPMSDELARLWQMQGLPTE